MAYDREVDIPLTRNSTLEAFDYFLVRPRVGNHLHVPRENNQLAVPLPDIQKIYRGNPGACGKNSSPHRKVENDKRKENDNGTIMQFHAFFFLSSI